MASRLIPFTIAGTICFVTAFILGAGFWYFFGTKKHSPVANVTVVQPANQNSVEPDKADANVSNTKANSNTEPTPTPKQAPAGEIKIPGGVVTLGGGETKQALKRINVADFAIGETEVTNDQYKQFIDATNHNPPTGWENNNFPAGTGNEPVTGVNWTDANDYCQWLSKELGATVRLPTEAEWERAARGDTGNKYPWGNSWKDESAQSLETKGKILPVKSFPAGVSPYGVYDMAGNVWEWTSDLALDEFGKPILFEKTKRRIIKGGSVKENREYLTIDARGTRPEDKPSDVLGFRYVVIRK